MKRSSTKLEKAMKPQNNWDLDLVFPDGKEFSSKYVHVPMEMIIKLSEESLPIVTSVPGFEETRLRQKCTVPFVL